MQPTWQTDDGSVQLYHGDCLEVMHSMGSDSVDAVIADPPYGTTACKWDAIIPLQPMWQQLKQIIKHNGAIVMMASQPFTTTLIASNLKMFRYCWIWDKIKGTGFLNAKKMPMRNHEDITIFYGSLPTYNPQKTNGHKRKISFRAKHLQTEVYGNMKNDYRYDSTNRYPRSILAIPSDTHNASVHPTQKPVALMEYLIKSYTNKGETVLDITMGSGTTGVACVRTERRFIGMEIDEKYFNIAVRRIKTELNRHPLFEEAS